MKEEIIIAGFGGQGVLSMGKNPLPIQLNGKIKKLSWDACFTDRNKEWLL